MSLKSFQSLTFKYKFTCCLIITKLLGLLPSLWFNETLPKHCNSYLIISGFLTGCSKIVFQLARVKYYFIWNSNGGMYTKSWLSNMQNKNWLHSMIDCWLTMAGILWLIIKQENIPLLLDVLSFTLMVHLSFIVWKALSLLQGHQEYWSQMIFTKQRKTS